MAGNVRLATPSVTPDGVEIQFEEVARTTHVIIGTLDLRLTTMIFTRFRILCVCVCVGENRPIGLTRGNSKKITQHVLVTDVPRKSIRDTPSPASTPSPPC